MALVAKSYQAQGFGVSCTSCRSFRNTNLANSRLPNKHTPFILLSSPFTLKVVDMFYICKLKTKWLVAGNFTPQWHQKVWRMQQQPTAYKLGTLITEAKRNDFKGERNYLLSEFNYLTAFLSLERVKSVSDHNSPCLFPRRKQALSPSTLSLIRKLESSRDRTPNSGAS